MNDAPQRRSPFCLRGRTALITGAGRGLGFQMAKALGAAGACVVINGRDSGRLEEAARNLRTANGEMQIDIAPFDVADTQAGSVAIDAIVSRHGALDILVNNAGARDRRALADFSSSQAAALIATDLVGPMMLAREAALHMAARGHGRLITVTSISGQVANRNDPVYTAAKAGLAGLMRSLAVDYAEAGITSNAIAPGMFATEANEPMVRDPRLASFVGMRVPAGRWGRPEEIGAAAVFLASDEASFVNGHVLVVDGGQTVRM